MEFSSIDALTHAMRALGAVSIYCKPLAENDNSKQQIYLGGSFEVLKQIPFSDLRSDPGVKRQNFKASLEFFWISADSQSEQARGAQLILYPDYPEVRLSGFLRGCSLAPATLLQPIPTGQRLHNNGPDGRYLFLGVTADKKVLAYLSKINSNLSFEMASKLQNEVYKPSGVLYLISEFQEADSRSILLARLHEIHIGGWHKSRRLNKQGIPIPYAAQNGGGYTLEALLGIKPNGEAAPDFMGWEVKAYSSSRITLMTPEPDSGFYGQHGVEAFVRKYGRQLPEDMLYFTGTHKAGNLCTSSGQTLLLDGFDSIKQKILNVDGGINLVDPHGEVSARWTFNRLITHWSRKHAAAVYVPYEKETEKPPKYQYKSPVLLGESTEFSLFLAALQQGKVVYDPGSKIEQASSNHARVKARSQFRVSLNALSSLYRKFESVVID